MVGFHFSTLLIYCGNRHCGTKANLSGWIFTSETQSVVLCGHKEGRERVIKAKRSLGLKLLMGAVFNTEKGIPLL